MPPEDKVEAGFYESEATKAFLAAGSADLLAHFDERRKVALGEMRRLKRHEYVNTIQDLLGYPLRNIETHLPEDDPASLHAAAVTDFHLARQVRAAEEALDYVLGRESKGEVTFELDLDILEKKNRKQAARARIPRDPEKGILLARSRVGGFSPNAEVKATRPIDQAGLYRVRARVPRPPPAHRLPHRHPQQQSYQRAGLGAVGVASHPPRARHHRRLHRGRDRGPLQLW